MSQVKMPYSLNNFKVSSMTMLLGKPNFFSCLTLSRPLERALTRHRTMSTRLWTADRQEFPLPLRRLRIIVFWKRRHRGPAPLEAYRPASRPTRSDFLLNPLWNYQLSGPRIKSEWVCDLGGFHNDRRAFPLSMFGWLQSSQLPAPEVCALRRLTP
jgi:hypothetical protein